MKIKDIIEQLNRFDGDAECVLKSKTTDTGDFDISPINEARASVAIEFDDAHDLQEQFNSIEEENGKHVLKFKTVSGCVERLEMEMRQEDGEKECDKIILELKGICNV